MRMVAAGGGRMYVMCEAGLAVRVDHQVMYVWNWRWVARTQVWYVLGVVGGQVALRECCFSGDRHTVATEGGGCIGGGG